MEELLQYGIRQLQSKVRKKEISISELLEFYEKRIMKYDLGEKGLHSIRNLAEQECNDWKRGIVQEPKKQCLYGIPILVKDNIDVCGMPTTAGSLALTDNLPLKDAPVIQNLRKQGALILGKTNMTELANFMTEEMPGGYSSAGGQVRYAYQREESPWGSSSGSAVSVSANFCAGAIGTDTSNSIVAVAMRNGIVGYKPPSHSLSRQGIIPISFTLDSAGPMTRNVEDAILIYEAMQGAKPKKWSKVSLRGKKIAINTWNRKLLSVEYNKAIDHLIDHLKEQKAIIEYVNLSASENLKQIMLYEFKFGLNQYLKDTKGSIRNLEQIIAFNEQHSEVALRYGQTYLLDAYHHTTGKLTDGTYLRIMEERKKTIEEMRKELEEYDACLLCAPNNLSHYLGLPTIALPHGLDLHGIPVGFIFTGVKEERLLRISLTIGDEVLKGYHPPILERDSSS